MTAWYENPAFWERMGPFLFREPRTANAPAEVDGILDLLALEPGAVVLDLCCGIGRHSVELHRRGFRVTGVDLTASYLEQARAAEPAVEWVRSDMRAFLREAAFDGAINIFTSFGYFEDPEDDLRVAENVRRSLRPGGRFLIDTMSKEVLARKLRPLEVMRLDDGSLFVVEQGIDEGWRGTQATWIWFRDQERLEYSFWHRLYAATELEALLLRAGFASVKLFGGLDGRPYDHQAVRLQALAEVG